jgi:predicted PurR-regulated permease PerM
VAIFFLILIPLLGLFLLLLARLETSLTWLAHEAATLAAPEGRLAGWARAAAARIGVDPVALPDALRLEAQSWLGMLAGRTLRLLSGIGDWILQAGVALFTLYYLLRDSRGILAAVRWLLPFPPAATDELLRRAHAVALATVYGNVVTAAIQGIAGGLVFWVLGLPAPLLWGTVMSFLGLLPLIGPPVVWLPAALALLVSGAVLRGVLLLVLGFLVISGIDNLARPLLVGGRAQLHPLVVFFSVLGGVYVLGAVGLVVGPVLFVGALTVIEMARGALEPTAGSRETGGVGILLHRPPASRRRGAATESSPP